MDPNFQKCTFLAFLSIEFCTCSLIIVALLLCGFLPIIIERGMRSVIKQLCVVQWGDKLCSGYDIPVCGSRGG